MNSIENKRVKKYYIGLVLITALFLVNGFMIEFIPYTDNMEISTFSYEGTFFVNCTSFGLG